MTQPLMPKATAVWLVDNTCLTFEQIAAFCGLHFLEVKGIADGEVAQGLKAQDPVNAGQLSREELDRCQADPSATLGLLKVPEPPVKRRGPRYTPLSRRQDRPDAIAWLLRNHPELNDSQVCKLVGTTRPTIQSVRNRSHWNMANIKPVDPVSLGLSTQIDLDGEIGKASRRMERAGGMPETPPDVTPPLSEPTVVAKPDKPEKKETPSAENLFGTPPKKKRDSGGDPDYDPNSVFAKLKALKETMQEPESPAKTPADAGESGDDQPGTGTV